MPLYPWGEECWYDAQVKGSKPTPLKRKFREVKVETRTLDSFDLPKISFIKCDANYHELWVLRGGLRTIRRDRPAMWIEVNPNPDVPGTTANEVFQLLAREGYSPYLLIDGELRLRQAGQRRKPASIAAENYFFLRPEHLDANRYSEFCDQNSGDSRLKGTLPVSAEDQQNLSRKDQNRTAAPQP